MIRSEAERSERETHSLRNIQRIMTEYTDRTSRYNTCDFVKKNRQYLRLCDFSRFLSEKL